MRSKLVINPRQKRFVRINFCVDSDAREQMLVATVYRGTVFNRQSRPLAPIPHTFVAVHRQPFGLNFFRDIVRTFFMKHFIYSRKSSEDDDRQALSITAQLSELGTIARSNNLSIVDTLTESKSAKEPGREVFNDMLRRIEAGEGNAVLTWKLDRLARNFEDGGKLIGLLQRGVIQEIRTFEKTYLPTDNVLTIAVELGMANQYVRDLSVNIRRGIREKIRRGISCAKAPLGYFNHPTLRTIEPHEKTFLKLKAVFEEFAKGEQELADVQRSLTRAGLVGQRNSKPLSFSTIGDLLRNPFYYGAFVHKGEVHQGVHQPMISKKMFDEIQQILFDIGKPRNGFRKQKGFLFLNFARCASCGYAITGERQIKRSGLKFHYYRCTHKNKKHACDDRAYTRQERFESEVKRNTALVTLPDEWKEKFLARLENWSEELQDRKQIEIERLKEKLAGLKQSFRGSTMLLPKAPLMLTNSRSSKIRSFRRRWSSTKILSPSKQVGLIGSNPCGTGFSRLMQPTKWFLRRIG